MILILLVIQSHDIFEKCTPFFATNSNPAYMNYELYTTETY